MYQPTTEELESIGFKNNSDLYWYMQVGNMPHTIKCYPKYDEWRMRIEGENVGESSVDINIYPQSKSDIETLIRLLTNN